MDRTKPIVIFIENENPHADSMEDINYEAHDVPAMGEIIRIAPDPTQWMVVRRDWLYPDKEQSHYIRVTLVVRRLGK
jgi:hypothetical protein